MTIERDSWRMIEIVIRRYPAKKREYEEYISDIMSSTHSEEYLGSSNDDYFRPQSVTEAKALKMTSVYADRLKKEIEAVEFVYGSLRPEEQKLIRERYWSSPKKRIPFERIATVDYSISQMRRIVKKTILQVGRYLGELR